MMRPLLFFFFLVFGCSSAERKQDFIPVKSAIEPVSPDTISEAEEKTPGYEVIFGKNLSHGFDFPLTTKSGNNFSYKFIADSSDKNEISAWVVFADNFIKPVEVSIPGIGTVHEFSKDSAGYSLVTGHSFFENGKIKFVSLRIEGIDSLIYSSSDFEHMGPDQNYGLVGYMLPKRSGLKRKLKISLEYNDGENKPFFIASVEEFFKEYKKCLVPKDLDRLIFAHKSEYKMYYFEKGVMKNEYTIGLSQSPIGHKQRQGDNKLPEGMYRITEKSRGPFYGETGPWLGKAWMQFSYPNRYDAINGYNKGSISLAEKNAIVDADKKLKPTNSYTELGGRVGLHGWNGDWIANGTQNLTWGCITMLNKDIDVFYDLIPLNTYIIIVP